MASRNRGDPHVATTRWAFIGALMIGSVGILVGTLMHSMLVTTIFPVSAMLGYLAFEWYRDHSTLDNPLFADSLYYLGFLLTLIALTVSLYSMGDDPDISGIVHRFGVALITTVLGLTLRIVLSGFNRGAEASMEEAEAAVESAVRRFRERLDQFSTDLLTQQAAFNQAMKNAVVQASSDLAGMVVASNGKIEAAATGLAQTAATGSTTLQSAIDTELTTTVSEIRGQTAEITRSLKALTQDVEDTVVPSDLFVRSLQEPLRRLVSSVQSISETLDADIPDLRPFSDNLRASLAQLATGFQELASKDLGGLQDDMREAGANLSSISRQLRAQLEEISVVVATPDGKPSGLAELANAAESASDGLGVLQNRQSEYLNALERQMRVLDALNKSSSETADLTAEHRQQIAQNLNESTKAVEKVFQDLTASVRLLRGSLERGA